MGDAPLLREARGGRVPCQVAMVEPKLAEPKHPAGPPCSLQPALPLPSLRSSRILEAHLLGSFIICK